jgi:hypothetical protein
MCQAWVTTTTRLMPSGNKISALICAFSQVVRLRSFLPAHRDAEIIVQRSAINCASLGGVP